MQNNYLSLINFKVKTSSSETFKKLLYTKKKKKKKKKSDEVFTLKLIRLK